MNFITKSMQSDDKRQSASKPGETGDQNQFKRVACLAVVIYALARVRAGQLKCPEMC